MAGERNERDLAAVSIKIRGPLDFGRIIAPYLKTILRFGRRKPLGAVGGLVVAGLVVAAALAPLVAPFDPYESHVKQRYAPPGETNQEEAGGQFLLGTDQLGRDTLSRLLHGARISLYVGLVSVGIGVTLGALLGIISGYLGGTVDLLVQRVVDAFMAFPALILALGIMAVLGASVTNVIITLVILFIPGSSRVVRSTALSIKESVYVEAARAVGGSDRHIIIRHVIPNCMAPYIVFATANVGFAIIVEASLSFLGLGSPPDAPSWGGMLSTAGRKYIEVAPWLLLWPSVAISIVVFGFNLLGDALRDVLDPRLRGTEGV